MFHGMDSSKTLGQAKMSGRFVILAGMTKWEYATVPLLTHATKQILDNWGKTVGNSCLYYPPTGEQHVAYLKRELD